MLVSFLSVPRRSQESLAAYALHFWCTQAESNVKMSRCAFLVLFSKEKKASRRHARLPPMGAPLKAEKGDGLGASFGEWRVAGGPFRRTGALEERSVPFFL